METFPWHQLSSMDGLEQISKKSFEIPVVIFKHSTRCNISSIAKMRLEEDALTLGSQVHFYYLDLLNHRDISAKIAEKYNVHHESPQILVIKDDECILDASHLDIQADEIEEVIAAC